MTKRSDPFICIFSAVLEGKAINANFVTIDMTQFTKSGVSGAFLEQATIREAGPI
jgi:hypothetical protein